MHPHPELYRPDGSAYGLQAQKKTPNFSCSRKNAHKIEFAAITNRQGLNAADLHCQERATRGAIAMTYFQRFVGQSCVSIPTSVRLFPNKSKNY